jgi:hypothetical protein
VSSKREIDVHYEHQGKHLKTIVSTSRTAHARSQNCMTAVPSCRLTRMLSHLLVYHPKTRLEEWMEKLQKDMEKEYRHVDRNHPGGVLKLVRSCYNTAYRNARRILKNQAAGNQGVLPHPPAVAALEGQTANGPEAANAHAGAHSQVIDMRCTALYMLVTNDQ